MQHATKDLVEFFLHEICFIRAMGPRPTYREMWVASGLVHACYTEPTLTWLLLMHPRPPITSYEVRYD